MFFLFATGTGYQGCTLGGINANNWIQINALVLLIAMSIGGVFWAFSNILNPKQGERLKGLVKVEVFQGVIGVIIIGILFASATAWCNIGASLTSSALSGIGVTSYQNPMLFSEAYLQNLVFRNGLSLFSSIYAETSLLMIDGIVLEHIAGFLPKLESGLSFVTVTFSPGAIGDTFSGYALALGTTASIVFSVVFGIAFVIYLILPFISATALTVVVPTAIVLRMVPFIGPRIREMSDLILSVAIAAYFIFPLMIIMNAMLLSYLYTACPGTSAGLGCNPYSSYLGPYTLASLPTGSLFQTNAQSLGGGGLFSLPKAFFGNILIGTGGFISTLLAGLKGLALLPSVFFGFVQEIAIFMFQGVFLIGLDILVTVVFAKALTEGLSAVSQYVSGGPFWG